MIVFLITLIALSVICFLFLCFLTVFHFINNGYKNKKLRNKTSILSFILIFLLAFIYVITGCEFGALIISAIILSFGTIVYDFFDEYLKSREEKGCKK